MNRIGFSLVTAMSVLVVRLNAIGQEEEKPTVPAPVQKPTRGELLEKQIDVALEARDIERLVGRLKRASDLAKSRITEAAKTSETASAALDKGDAKSATTDAKQASEMFREIAKQLEALLVEETPQRVAAAQNLAKQLAKMERDFAKDFAGVLNPKGSGTSKVDPMSVEKNQQGQGGTAAGPQNDPKGKDKQSPPQDVQSGAGKKNDDKQQGEGSDNKPDAEKKEGEGGTDKTDPEKKTGGGIGTNKQDPETKSGGGGADKPDAERKAGGGADKPKTEAERQAELVAALAARAEQLEKTGETLKDVLQALAKSTDPADKDAAKRLEAILNETDLMKALEAMQDISQMIRAGKLQDAKQAAIDLAERLEIAAQRLDAAYRAIVAPQAEELRKLEQQVAGMRERLEALETQSQIAAWHRDVQQAADEAEKLGVSSTARDDLLDQLKVANQDPNGFRHKYDWMQGNGRYVAPDGYERPLIKMQEEIQQRIQNLLFGDIVPEADEATPPKYLDLVERYYQVLSREASGQKTEPAPATPRKGK